MVATRTAADPLVEREKRVSYSVPDKLFGGPLAEIRRQMKGGRSLPAAYVAHLASFARQIEMARFSRQRDPSRFHGGIALAALRPGGSGQP